ncbi:MAG: hypothetical protein MJZ21_05055 [archaeon]|nr:hypothetical protein [archaeon]
MMAKAYPTAPTLVLVITNDSTVFLKNGIASAFEMFGGRCQEVKNLVARLDLAHKTGEPDKKLCQVSFGIISSRFGYVPADYTVMPYPKEEVMDSPEDYEAVQEKKNYLGMIDYTCKLFDRIVVCVPKHMMKMIMDANVLPTGRVIAVTSPDFKEECEKRDWLFLERKGARVGAENADIIFEEVRKISE